ncbi:MAG: dihydrofolate reductase family protein [Patescibacteria group bacterium]
MHEKTAVSVINLIAAITIDGKISTGPGNFPDWTSVEDKNFLHQMLDSSDVAVVGRTTFELAKKPLSKRNCIVFTKSVSDFRTEREGLVFCNPSGISLARLLGSYARIAVLGGTGVYTWFLKKGLADNLYLTIEPISFGAGVPLFADHSGAPFAWRLISSTPLNMAGSILLHYVPC